MLLLSFATICSADSLNDLIVKYADKYGVASTTISKIVQCESSGNYDAIGDNGDSLGLVQIDLKFHPDVSRNDAFDPEFSLNFLAYYLSIGKGNLWTCYRRR